MGLFTEREKLTDYKKENWWLRLTIVVTTLTLISTLVYYNKQTTQQVNVKSLSDSIAYYKTKCDSLSIENRNITNFGDSVRDELFIKHTIIGRYEMGMDFLKERRPNEHNLMMHFINTQTE
jgi:hypothetical protein